MQTKELKNKEGVVMKTKEGKTLYEHRFDVGDEFIPVFNKPLENTNEVEYKGKQQKFTTYKIKCVVRNGETGETYKDPNGEEEIFVTLTKSQADTLQKKLAKGEQINQHLFVVYEYESEDYGTQVGIGYKASNKPHKTFEDFEKAE